MTGRICGMVRIAQFCLNAMPTTSSSDRTDASRSVSGLACLLLINALLVLPLWWRDGSALSVWLVPEVLLLPLLAALFSSSLARWLLAVVVCFGLLTLSGNALVHDVLGRPLNLLLDPLLLRAGYHFLSGSLGPWVAFAIALGAIGSVALIVWALHALISLLQRALSPAWCGLLALLALITLAAGTWLNLDSIARPALIQMVSAQTNQIATTLADQRQLIERASSDQLQAQAIPALAGRDVVVVFIESYGMTAWSRTDYRAVIKPLLDAFEGDLDAAGLQVTSTRLRSPIRGGQSWLAHASLLSGQRINNDFAYDQILKSGQQFLTNDFAATGHTPLVVAPAIVRPWPEAEALGFKALYPAATLNYRGPRAGWVGIPDQITLHRYGQSIRSQHAEPVFSLVLLISSHAPWLAGPPLLDDWQLLDQPQPWPSWTPPPRDRLVYLRDRALLRARYPQSLAYSLSAALQWAAHKLPPDGVLMLIGDHQPATLITGPESSNDVPVHLISFDAHQLARDDLIPFQPGFQPGTATSQSGLEDLREWLRRR